MDESRVNVPLPVRLEFGHAAVQHVAQRIGADILHIKGVAVDPSLRPRAHAGTDVDVVVRPADVARLDQALRDHGWRLYSTFEYGSPFGHAQTYVHDMWGYLDIHRYFPGVGVEPAVAFDLLWGDRHSVGIAGVACPVPGVPAQAALLVLNAARMPEPQRFDVGPAWRDAPPDRRAAMMAVVERLHAEVAFAAATGALEHHRAAPDYLLWRVVSEGGPRSLEWWARLRAAPTVRERLRIAFRAPRVNVDHLAHRLGRSPTRAEVALEFVRRPSRAIAEALTELRGRIGRWGRP